MKTVGYFIRYNFNGYIVATKIRDNKIQELISVLESTPSLINTTDDEKRTALHWAVDRDNIEATKRLIELGSDINLQDIDGCTVLERILFLGNSKIIFGKP